MVTKKELFRFYVEDENLKNILHTQKNQSQFINDTLISAKITNELVPATQLSETKELDTEIKKARLKHLEKSNLKLDIQNRIALVHDMKFSPMDALKIAKGEKDIDADDSLRCPDCNWAADKTRTIQNQVDSMIYHIKDIHKRKISEDEQAMLLEIVGQ